MKFKTLLATFLLATACLYSLHSVARDNRGGSNNQYCKNNPRHPDCRRHELLRPRPTPQALPERSPKQCDSDNVLCEANKAQYNACRALKNSGCERYLDDDNGSSSSGSSSGGINDTDDVIARANEALHNACIALGRTDCD